MMKRLLLTLVLLILLGSLAAAQDQVMINSRDWQDVYSGMIYSQLQDLEANYPIEESRAQLLINTLDEEKEQILLIESDNPYVSNYATQLASAGFQVEVFDYEENINLDLARRGNFTKFIVMDSRFAYNAVSIAPYASLEDYYVIFADQFNIDEVTGILEGAEEVIQYGYVDREVSNALEQFNPEVINEGSKYENNIEVVKRFMEEKNSTQFVLTNGEFIEPQFFAGEQPVVFIGNSNIPDITLDFLKESDVKHGIVIGNELVDLASSLKDSADMNLMVKFAKGINQQQYTLSTISLPTPDYNPRMTDLMYNTLSNELVITVENQGETPVMAKGSYTVTKDNESVATVGDDEAIFIPGGGVSTQTYSVDIEEGPAKVQANILYGEDKNSLEEMNIQTSGLDFIEINDNSELSVEKVYYDKAIKRFVINIKNTGEETVYSTGFIDEFLLNEREQMLSTDEIIQIDPQETKELKIKADLTELDIEENENISLNLRYGAQKNMLLKTSSVQKELIVKTLNGVYIAAVAVAAFIVAMLLIFWRKKKNAAQKGKTGQ